MAIQPGFFSGLISGVGEHLQERRRLEETKTHEANQGYAKFLESMAHDALNAGNGEAADALLQHVNTIKNLKYGAKLPKDVEFGTKILPLLQGHANADVAGKQQAAQQAKQQSEGQAQQFINPPPDAATQALPPPPTAAATPAPQFPLPPPMVATAMAQQQAANNPAAPSAPAGPITALPPPPAGNIVYPTRAQKAQSVINAEAAKAGVQQAATLSTQLAVKRETDKLALEHEEAVRKSKLASLDADLADGKITKSQYQIARANIHTGSKGTSYVRPITGKPMTGDQINQHFPQEAETQGIQSDPAQQFSVSMTQDGPVFQPMVAPTTSVLQQGPEGPVRAIVPKVAGTSAPTLVPSLLPQTTTSNTQQTVQVGDKVVQIPKSTTTTRQRGGAAPARSSGGLPAPPGTEQLPSGSRVLGNTPAQERREQENPLTPAAQKVVMTADPTLQAMKRIKAALESVKTSNDPFHYGLDRILYGAGVATGSSNVINQTEMQKVAGAARLLQGSSRSREALERAMVHLPTIGVDSPKKMYEQVDNVITNLTDIIDSAKKEGKKYPGMTKPPDAATVGFKNNGTHYDIPADRVDAFKQAHPSAVKE
jgi:hypothetical protein